MGLRSFARDLDIQVSSELYVNANATIGTLHRSGLGKLRHVDAADLRMQDAIKSRSIALKKIWGKDNPADLMTKYLTEQEIMKHMDFLSFE